PSLTSLYTLSLHDALPILPRYCTLDTRMRTCFESHCNAHNDSDHCVLSCNVCECRRIPFSGVLVPLLLLPAVLPSLLSSVPSSLDRKSTRLNSSHDQISYA